MSMRTASQMRGPCEVIRKINDLVQEDTPVARQIRALCTEAELKTKKFAQRLNVHEKEVWKNWWEKNPTYRADAKRRLRKEYKVENAHDESTAGKGK